MQTQQVGEGELSFLAGHAGIELGYAVVCARHDLLIVGGATVKRVLTAGSAEDRHQARSTVAGRGQKRAAGDRRGKVVARLVSLVAQASRARGPGKCAEAQQ